MPKWIDDVATQSTVFQYIRTLYTATDENFRERERSKFEFPTGSVAMTLLDIVERQARKRETSRNYRLWIAIWYGWMTTHCWCIRFVQKDLWKNNSIKTRDLWCDFRGKCNLYLKTKGEVKHHINYILHSITARLHLTHALDFFLCSLASRNLYTRNCIHIEITRRGGVKSRRRERGILTKHDRFFIWVFSFLIYFLLCCAWLLND